ncbi:unnamed protein product, partial [Prorocentrum cordatum]
TGPRITLPGQSLSQLPAAKLCAFSAQRGLRAVVDVPRLSEQPLLSCAGGRAVCVWRAMLNEVPEEAERGEFLACELTPRSPARCASRGAPAEWAAPRWRAAASSSSSRPTSRRIDP